MSNYFFKNSCAHNLDYRCFSCLLKFGRSGEHLSPEKGTEGKVKIVSNVKEPAAGLRKRPILHLWQQPCEQQSNPKKICLQKEKESVMPFFA
jgi:hypothetical protein